MKKLLLSMMALTMMLVGCGTGESESNSSTSLEDAKVGVVQLMQHDALDQSYEGFKDVLVEAGVSESNIDYQVAGEVSNCQIVADKLVNDGNSLIYAIATPALQAVAAATQDIPVVGCAITDYESTKLINSNEEPGGNITGASDLTPVTEQIDLIKQLLPEASKVAVMYCGSEDNSIIQGNMAKEAIEAAGLEYAVYTVSDSNEIQAVTEKIVSDGNDVVYIPTDNLLATYMASVEAITSEAGIPVIAGCDTMVIDGGYATYGLNYYNLGRLAGEQAVAILKGEATAATTPIAYLEADDCELIINLKVAEKCGLSTDKADYPEGATFTE